MTKKLKLVSLGIKGSPEIPDRPEFAILKERRLRDEDWPEIEKAVKAFRKWAAARTDDLEAGISAIKKEYVPAEKWQEFDSKARQLVDALAQISKLQADGWNMSESLDFRLIAESVPKDARPGLEAAIRDVADHTRYKTARMVESRLDREYEMPETREKYQEAIAKLPDGAKAIGEEIHVPQLYEVIHGMGVIPLGYQQQENVLYVYITRSQLGEMLGEQRRGHVRKSLYILNNTIMKSAHNEEYGNAGVKLDDQLKDGGMYASVHREYVLNMKAWKRGVYVLKPLAVVHDVDTGDEWLLEQMGMELERRFKEIIERYAETRGEAEWAKIVKYAHSAYAVALSFEEASFTSPDLKGRNAVVVSDIFGRQRVMATDVFPQRHRPPRELTEGQRTRLMVDPESMPAFEGVSLRRYPNTVLSDLRITANNMEHVPSDVREKIVAEVERLEVALRKRIHQLEAERGEG